MKEILRRTPKDPLDNLQTHFSLLGGQESPETFEELLAMPYQERVAFPIEERRKLLGDYVLRAGMIDRAVEDAIRYDTSDANYLDHHLLEDGSVL